MQNKIRQQLEDLHPKSFGWAMCCCKRDRNEAEDILQEAYLKILEGRASYSDKGAFKSWLFSVIRNTAIDRQRKKQRQWKLFVKCYHKNEVDNGIQFKWIEEEKSQYIQGVIKKLSGRQRQVLHLVFYQALTIEEAAEIMEISIGSARKHYERGKNRMRKLLEKEQLY